MVFSKFAELRPKHCILAGASGTHSVCVCTIHQHLKLMLLSMRLLDLATYHHCLARISCNPPLPKCYLGECDACPGVVKFKEELIVLLDMDQIVYKQWIATYRSTLETFCVPAEEFIDIFCEKLELLRPHSFIASDVEVQDESAASGHCGLFSPGCCPRFPFTGNTPPFCCLLR